jgi:modification methylase
MSKNPLNQIFNSSCEDMKELDEGSVNLVVTSPPYYNLRDYSEWKSYADHLIFIKNVLDECYRVLMPGGWICWNIQECIPFPPAETKKERECMPLLAHTISLMSDIGFLYEKDIIWYKGKGTATQKLFGSYPYPGLILTSGLTEHIITARKPRGKFKRKIDPEIKEKSILTKQEWGDWAVDIWDVPPVNAKNKNHPAPYPVEIPRRCIRLNSLWGDLVLDPFMGGGTTAIACSETGRNFVGYEIHKKYIDLSLNRIRFNNMSVFE